MAETFQRARSEEQREIRRAVILDTASTMLREAPVAALTLNELARRVGLAKSNVLRYFESREAVLLDLLASELDAWLTAVRTELGDPADTGAADSAVTDTAAADTGAADITDPASVRRKGLVSTLVATLQSRPVLCDLLSAQAGVLERNVSPAIAAKYKRDVIGDLRELAAVVRERLPALSPEDSRTFARTVLMMAGAVWPHAHPAEAMKTAYSRDPELAALALDFTETLGKMLTTFLTGLLAMPRPYLGDHEIAL